MKFTLDEARKADYLSFVSLMRDTVKIAFSTAMNLMLKM
jgi:hypothetical protein